MTPEFKPFHYKGARLYAESVPLESLAEKFGTPLYVYSAGKLRRQFERFDGAFRGTPHTICYAMKANGNLAVLHLLAKLGAGVDIVSGGELFRALKAGFPARRVVFSGVGKREDEILAALKAGIFMFNVESASELQAIHEVSMRARLKAPVSIRVNPDVHVDTHHHITTGKAENKFGVPFEEAEGLYKKALRMPWLKIRGIQSHIGSQITSVAPYRETLKKLLSLIGRLASAGVRLEVIDLGGGLGVTYRREKPPVPEDLARALKPLLASMAAPAHLIFEPGRYLASESGCLLTRVIYRKETRHKNFLIVDAAMNDLARPALYDAYHPILPLRKKGGGSLLADVVGPVCESGDYLAKARMLPKVEPGGYLAVLVAGAYGFSMSSQYNARPRAAEVMVSGKKSWLVREREGLKDLVRGERIPGGLAL